jgi:hypothetical protein
LWFIAIDNLEATYRLFDRHRGEVQERLDRASDLLVLLGDAPEELDGSLLVVGVVAELHHLLLQSVKTESKVINVLTWPEGQVLPLLAKCLQRGLEGAVAADACHSDGIPNLLGSPLLRKRELHLGRDFNNEGIQRPSILIVIDVVVPNCFPDVSHLEPYPHHRGPLDVVGLGEGRPPTIRTDVPNTGPDPMVTKVPIRGGRAAPYVKAAISVNPTADASAPFWAAAAVGGTTAARGLAGLGGEDDGADALDLHTGGIPKFDGASDIGVKLSEELPLTGHVMGGAVVEAPPASLIAAGAVVEEGVCSRLIKVEESRCGRCHWR